MLSFFCETCSQAIRPDLDAAVSDHKETAGHSVANIGDTGPSYGYSFECQLQTGNTPWTQIQRDIQCIESKMKEIQAHKDSALEDLDSYIHYVRRQFELCHQEATDAILQHHASQYDKLLGKHRQLKRVTQLLDIGQGKQMAESDDIGEAMRSTETIKIVTELTTQDSDLLDQRKSVSSLTTEPNLPDENLCNIGKTCLQSVLLTSVQFGSYDITAGLRAVIAVELFNDAGKKVPFAASLLTVRITDPQDK